MPLLGALPLLLGIGGSVASGIGGMLGQSAANKGPQSMFPQQLQQYLQMLSGPGGIGSTAGQGLQSMIATGNPTNVGPAWNAMVTANQQQTTQGLNSLMSQFAGGGARYSSGAMMAGNNYLTQSNNNFMNVLANYTMQAQEAAANRQLSAINTGFGAMGNIAGMFTQPKGSVVGTGLNSAGNSLQLLSLLQSLNSGGGGGNSVGSTMGWG